MSIITINDYYIVNEESCGYDSFALVKIDFKALLNGIKEVKKRCKQNNVKVKNSHTMAQIKVMEILADELNKMYDRDMYELEKYNLNFYEEYGVIHAKIDNYSDFKKLSESGYGVQIGSSTIIRYGELISLCRRIQELLNMDLTGCSLIGF